jgi:hypothetical protein
MIREASIVRLHAGEKDGRPGVVLRLVEQDGKLRAVVMYGTSTPQEGYGRGDFEKVHHLSIAGQSIGLKNETYFCKRNLWVGPPEKLVDTGRLCFDKLFPKLQGLIGL